MSKALEAMGFTLPAPEKPASRYNNLKMSFDKYLRSLWVDCLSHTMEDMSKSRPELRDALIYLSNLELEPLATRENIEKNDYIIKKQAEKLEKLGRIEEYKDIFEQYVQEQEEELEKELTRSRNKRR